jgi:hypothetical protein
MDLQNLLKMEDFFVRMTSDSLWRGAQSLLKVAY